MPSATASLPSDPEALRALAITLHEALATKDRELAARDAEIYAKTLHIEKLRAMLALMSAPASAAPRSGSNNSSC
jgi:hypothetical protein